VIAIRGAEIDDILIGALAHLFTELMEQRHRDALARAF
jgi:hypothetical protein